MGSDEGKVRKGWKSNFFQAPNQIYETDISGYAKAVYVYLCRRADNEGQSFPGYATIALDVGFSKSTVRRAVGELIQSGLLVKHSRGRKANGEHESNLYTVIHPLDVAPRVCSHRPHPSTSISSQNIPSVSKNIPSFSESKPMAPRSTEVDSVTKPIPNTSSKDNKQVPVVEDVRRSLESIFSVSIKTLTDLPKWIDTYGPDYLVQKAKIVVSNPPKDGWKNTVGAYRSAVLQNWSATSSTAQLDVGGRAPLSQYDIRYHHYYIACEGEQYLSYCQSHPEYVAQLVAQYGSGVLKDIPGASSGGDDDVALWS